jgi:hypothetical protein
MIMETSPSKAYGQKSPRPSFRIREKKYRVVASAMTKTLSVPAGRAPYSSVQPIQNMATLTAARIEPMKRYVSGETLHGQTWMASGTWQAKPKARARMNTLPVKSIGFNIFIRRII